MSSLVSYASRFDADVTYVKWAFFRLREVVSAAKRELDKHGAWRCRHNLLSQEDLNQCVPLMRHRRVIWFSRLLPLSLIRLVLLTCRALVSGAVWFLHYSGRLILTRSPWLAESAHALAPRVAEVRWAKLPILGSAPAIAAVMLVTISVVFAAKSVPPAEVVLPILPDAQSPITLTAAARGEVLGEHIGTSGPSLSAAPGFTRVSLLSDATPERLPAFGTDIASMMLLMAPLPAPKATSGINRPTEITETRPLPRTGTPSTISRTTAVAAAPANVGRTAPAVPRPVAETPEPTLEPPQDQQIKPTQAGQRRDFVPHPFW